jgi:nucleoporin NUP82
VLGEDVDYEEGDSDAGSDAQAPRGSKKLDARLRRAADKNAELLARHERLRRRLAGVAARPLSENEAAWAAEVRRLRGAAGLEAGSDDEDDYEADKAAGGDDDDKKRGRKEAWQRLDEARAVAASLLEQVRELAPQESDAEAGSEHSNGASTPSASGRARQVGGGAGWKVPADVRQRRVAQVMGLLERESALVDAARERLERLSLMAGA